MTVTQIKNGIIARLDGAFSDIPAHGEKIKQGVGEKATFFVMALASDGKKEIGRRRRRSADFDVHYFPPKSAKQNDDLYAKGDALIELFEYVDTADGKVRPTSVRYEVVDDVLHLFLSFSWFARADAVAVPKVTKIDMEVS